MSGLVFGGVLGLCWEGARCTLPLGGKGFFPLSQIQRDVEMYNRHSALQFLSSMMYLVGTLVVRLRESSGRDNVRRRIVLNGAMI